MKLKVFLLLLATPLLVGGSCESASPPAPTETAFLAILATSALLVVAAVWFIKALIKEPSYSEQPISPITDGGVSSSANKYHLESTLTGQILIEKTASFKLITRTCWCVLFTYLAVSYFVTIEHFTYGFISVATFLLLSLIKYFLLKYKVVNDEFGYSEDEAREIIRYLLENRESENIRNIRKVNVTHSHVPFYEL